MVAAIVMGVIYLATVLSEQVYGRYCQAILIRQLIHLVVIVVACAALSPQFVHELMVWVANSNIIFIALGYLLILKPASTLVGILLKPWSEHLTKSQDTPTSLANAGQWIGYLERFIALTFILSHQYAAVGWILGAKSIFRFGELRNSHDKKLTEYIMVGTLASFAVTILIGVLVNSLQEIG
ncbi:hypothetical protein [Celerinatantimonas sp. MCCC 1A17872]|uniref:hypothetical protein n=1 Tax=Celerinatantimonas sp. MCCC 1A17872 TaxID=3177514 RepID=UPI0038C002C8